MKNGGWIMTSILSQGWCRACDRQRFPSFVRIDARGLDSPRVHVLVDASESKRFWVRIGELSGAGAPLDFSKSLTYTSDSFQRSGRRSVARHSVAMPSPRNKFSRARVTDGDGTGDMGEDEEDWGADGAACSSLPTLGKWLFCSPSSNADHKQAGRLTLSDARTATNQGAYEYTIRDRPPHLMRADTGLRIDEHWLSNGGAQRSRGGEVWRPAICLSGARLALECPPQFRAHLAHRAPQCLDQE